MQLNIGDAKKRWAHVVAAVERGEEVVLARNGRPVVKIVGYPTLKAKQPVPKRR